jgi:hypothetical protein
VIDNDGPTQRQVRAFHSQEWTTAAIAKELSLTPDRVRKIHSALRLLPWPSKRRTAKKAHESRSEIERRIAVRRAAVCSYWRQHPTATASDVALALRYPLNDVKTDRITLGLSVRRGPEGIQQLADHGLSAAEISRRCGVGAELVRSILAARQASTD